MNRAILAPLALVAFAASAPAHAALKIGAAAPDFTAQASLAGKPFAFKLSDALKKGPVVLYFFPSAFTSGCTIEAHMFAEASADYAKLGATLIGVTAGKIDRVAEFSKTECRDKFAVAADPGAKIAKSYNSTIPLMGLSDRTSYVIAPGGKVILSFSDMAPDQHVAKTMDAVKAWRATHPL